MSEPLLSRPEHDQDLRRARRRQQRELRCRARRGRGPARRQRRGQVDAHQMRLRAFITPTRARSSSTARRFNSRSPMDARRAGIETIYQDLALANNLDVGANIFLGREVKRRHLGGLDPDTRRQAYACANRAKRSTPCKFAFPTLTQPIEKLSGGQRQAVAIARAVYWEAELMIMDEPTNNLGVPEQHKVLELIRMLQRPRRAGDPHHPHHAGRLRGHRPHHRHASRAQSCGEGGIRDQHGGVGAIYGRRPRRCAGGRLRIGWRRHWMCSAARIEANFNQGKSYGRPHGGSEV